MPQLRWNELDFLKCLEVIPEVEEYEISHAYEVTRDGIILRLSVWQFESVIRVAIFREATDPALVELALFVRGGVRHVDDKRGDYLEVRDCVIGPSRFWYLQAGDPSNREKHPVGVNVEIAVKPAIRLHVGETGSD